MNKNRPKQIKNILSLLFALLICMPLRSAAAYVSTYKGVPMSMPDYRYMVADIFDTIENDLWYWGDWDYENFSRKEMLMIVLKDGAAEYPFEGRRGFYFINDELFYEVYWHKGETLRGDFGSRLHVGDPYYKEEMAKLYDVLRDAEYYGYVPGFKARKVDFEIFHPERLERNLRLVEEDVIESHRLHEYVNLRITFGCYRDGWYPEKPEFATVLIVVEADDEVHLYDYAISKTDYSAGDESIYAFELSNSSPSMGPITMGGEGAEFYERNMRIADILREDAWRVSEFRYGQRVEE